MNSSVLLSRGEFPSEEESDLELTTPFISFSQVQEIASELFDSEGAIYSEDEIEISEKISPLIENGRALHQELLDKVAESEEWNTLSEEEKDSIINFSNDQHVVLSLIYFLDNPNLEYEANEAGIDAGVIKDCVSFALGVRGIQEIIQNTKSLITVKDTIKVLKIIGRRYLGFVGLAWMIWDFMDCVASFND